MKTKILLIAFLLVSISFSNAQVVVKVKPAKPKVVVVKNKRPSVRHVWIDGHWNWSQRHHKYVWVKGKWVKPKQGYVWIAGHWRQKPNGFVWTKGYWRKRIG